MSETKLNTACAGRHNNGADQKRLSNPAGVPVGPEHTNWSGKLSTKAAEPEKAGKKADEKFRDEGDDGERRNARFSTEGNRGNENELEKGDQRGLPLWQDRGNVLARSGCALGV